MSNNNLAQAEMRFSNVQR